MSLYQKIKSAITVRQVGEMYGMEPDRHGMVCCPFHSDSHPSMKLNDILLLLLWLAEPTAMPSTSPPSCST